MINDKLILYTEMYTALACETIKNCIDEKPY